MRDLLPSDHPVRRRGMFPWVLYLVVGLLQIGVLVALAEARPLGAVLVALTAVAYLYIVISVIGLVRAVGVNHRAAVALTRPPG